MTSAGEPDSAWERGTARVLHDGRPVGVAFLIPDQLLLTCAHVIASTAGLPDDEPLHGHGPRWLTAGSKSGSRWRIKIRCQPLLPACCRDDHT